jgi:hypothetical protein
MSPYSLLIVSRRARAPPGVAPFLAPESLRRFRYEPPRGGRQQATGLHLPRTACTDTASTATASTPSRAGRCAPSSYRPPSSPSSAPTSGSPPFTCDTTAMTPRVTPPLNRYQTGNGSSGQQTMIGQHGFGRQFRMGLQTGVTSSSLRTVETFSSSSISFTSLQNAMSTHRPRPIHRADSSREQDEPGGVIPRL